ncbi:MAG: hypothetical protein QOF83_1219 [Solirubrobacteraceae bacterium]|jgi:hypothetical protein|nr:hypothetical protein [Solirubrobacteraceae bacterium]
MTRIRSTLVAGLVATAALAAGAPAASASTPFTMPSAFTMPSSFTIPSWPAFNAPQENLLGNPTNAGACASTPGPQGQGATGGTTATVCQGTGLSFVGPAIGQIATVIGPTIIGPAVIGNVTVSAGSSSVG